MLGVAAVFFLSSEGPSTAGVYRDDYTAPLLPFVHAQGVSTRRPHQSRLTGVAHALAPSAHQVMSSSSPSPTLPRLERRRLARDKTLAVTPALPDRRGSSSRRGREVCVCSCSSSSSAVSSQPSDTIASFILHLLYPVLLHPLSLSACASHSPRPLPTSAVKPRALARYTAHSAPHSQHYAVPSIKDKINSAPPRCLIITCNSHCSGTLHRAR